MLIQAYGNQANRLQAFVLTSICPSSKSPQANVPQQIGASDCPSAIELEALLTQPKMYADLKSADMPKKSKCPIVA